MGIDEVNRIGEWIVEILKDPENETLTTDIGRQVGDLCANFPIRMQPTA